MNMNASIRQYIKIAQDNGLRLSNIDGVSNRSQEEYLYLIMSKEFIQSIAHYIVDKHCNNDGYDGTEILVKYGEYPYQWKMYNLTDDIAGMLYIMNDITKFQAIAIRDKKLEEFINTILGLNTK